MAHEEFEKLIAKKTKTTEDAGRILLFELVERKRVDCPPQSRISYEEIDKIISAALKNAEPGDGKNSIEIFEHYRAAYALFTHLPSTVELNRYQSVMSLAQARDLAIDCEDAELLRLKSREAPVVLTAKQYKELKRQAKTIKKKKLSIYDIFFDIFDYLIERHDLPRYKIPIKVEAEQIDSYNNERWWLKHYAAWQRRGLVKRGHMIKPFQSLLDRKKYYYKEADLAEDFPGLVESILEYMEEQCGFKNSTRLFAKGAPTKQASVEMPSISIAELLESPISFLYRQYDIIPQNVAIIEEPIPEGSLKLEDGNYIPTTPYWVKNCYEYRDDNLLSYVPSLLHTAYERIRVLYRWHVMFSLYADTLKIPTLASMLKETGEESQIATEYLNVVNNLYDFYYNRLMENEISRATFEDFRNTFLRINPDALWPKEHNVEKVRQKMSTEIFVSSIYSLYDELV